MLHTAFKFFPLQGPYTQRPYTWCFFYKFQYGLCNESYYGESIRCLDIRSGEHIVVSPLTGKKVKPLNNSANGGHFPQCNFLPSTDNFSILAHENKKYLLEIK